MWKRDTSPRPVVDETPPPTAAPPTPAPAPNPPRLESRPAETVIMNLGKSVMIKGELSASEDLTLYGQMEGTVALKDHTLTIGPDADIRAQITASVVIVTGSVTGDVTANKKVEIRSTGSVQGDVTSAALVIQEGGRLQGKVSMRNG